MKIYAENRIWFIGAKLLPNVDNNIIYNKITIFGSQQICKKSSCKVSYEKDKIDYYSNEKSVLQIILYGESLALVNNNISDLLDLISLEKVYIRFTGYGFLNIISVYNILKLNTLCDDIEIYGMRASEKINIVLIPEIENLLKDLYGINVISSQKNFHFGVPKFLACNNFHGASESYLYNQHLFILDKYEFEKIISDKCPELQKNIIEYENCRVKLGWGFSFWLLSLEKDNTNHISAMVNINDSGMLHPEPPENYSIFNSIAKLLEIDSLALCESVIYDNSISSYTAILGIIANDEKIDSKLVRNIFNENNYLLQKMRLNKRNLSVEQEKFIRQYAVVANFDEKRELISMAENSLKFAIDGIDVEDQQSSNRKTQIILSFFTLITLYSVFSDIVSVLNSSDPSLSSFVTVRSALLLLLTVIVTLVFDFIRSNIYNISSKYFFWGGKTNEKQRKVSKNRIF